MLQDLWRKELPSDEPMSEEVATIPILLHSEMKQLSEIKIRRRLLPVDTTIKLIHLLVFCDTSKKGIYRVFYARAVHEDQVILNIVAAKTRVPALKNVTLPTS